MPNIYLIGMMGSGKTVVGKALALLMNCGFVDIDELIQEKTHQSIPEIFSNQGEEFFRNQESLILNEVSAFSPRVVGTGGGTILSPANVKRMRETGKIIYLETSLDVLWERVKDKKDRPLLQGSMPEESLKKIFLVRRPIYEQVCHFKVSTDSQTVEALARQILERLKHVS